MAAKQGYFLIADITGYTQYLSESELDHAEKILTALLGVLIQHTKPPLVISRLAGDAVISYGLREGFVEGQTFVEMLEDTYVSFRRQIELMVRNTTCPCNACRNIGSLDLKFFVHFGEFNVQHLDVHDELLGSDVNHIHRLLKNTVTEATGLRAYALYTDAAIQQLGLTEDTAKFIAHAESYEHLGEVRAWIQNMHPVWDAMRESLQIRIADRDVLYSVTTEIAAPSEVVWDFIVVAERFVVLLGGDRGEVIRKDGARVAVGSAYQCYHGDHVISNAVVSWHPFTQMTIQFDMPIPIRGVTGLVELRLEPTDTGTRLTKLFGRSRGPFLGRLMGDHGLRQMRPRMIALLDVFKAQIEADLAQRRRNAPTGAPIAEAEISAAARASLAAA